MDTDYDFLQPEFLNILFFQQKSLVIFPYVDLKHLKVLEVFSEGYTIIDIDTTTLHSLSSIINHEIHHSYSLKPVLYFIINANHNIIKELMSFNEIHCIINTSENVETIAEGDNFIFYNKKTRQFLNFNMEARELSYEQKLLQESRTEHILVQKLRDIHTSAAQIHSYLNDQFSKAKIPNLLERYDSTAWKKILLLTSRYYNKELPDITIPSHYEPKSKKEVVKEDFSNEYQRILKINKIIGKEFIQELHNYREKNVNPANLELDQLFYPEKLYAYLRSHHWEKGIPQDFIDNWVLMKNTGHTLTENDLLDFEILFQELGLPIQQIENPKATKRIQLTKVKHTDTMLEHAPKIQNAPPQKIESKMPSVKDFTEFKSWILHRIEILEKRILNNNK